VTVALAVGSVVVPVLWGGAVGCSRPVLRPGQGGDHGGEDDDGDPDDPYEPDEPDEPDDPGGGGGGGGGGGRQECREVDFLFVIDDSPSMGEYQARVLANYDVFVDGIEAAIDTIETTHIGVITAGPYAYNDPQCDALGGLVVRTGGPGSSLATCGPYAAGENYMTEADNISSAFPCAAKVGVGGTDLDLPLAAALSAVSPPLTEPGECNHGFLGEGALLVLVIVTETYPNNFQVQDVDPYFASTGLVEVVGGYDDIVVVLIASTEQAPCLSPLAPGLETFAEQFDHSYIGAICEKDYSQVFAPAIEVVKAACPG
jgi:hypothetical protein